MDPFDLGPFTVLGELGRGGMGVVLDAVHRRRDLPVAIKILETPDAVAITHPEASWRVTYHTS